jgi:hypothetical protein
MGMFAVFAFAFAAGWSDTPAVVAAGVAPVEDALRACFRAPLPQRIGFFASRGDDGGTIVAMPLPASVGHRGLTPEERCLMRTIARIELPPLPEGIDRIALGQVIVAAGDPAPAADAAFADWRDPAATLAPALDAHRPAMAACDRRPRTVRLVVDLRRGRTRVWLPAWQFHSKRGDGTTPARERPVKACLRRAVAGWRLPALPRAMAELQLSVPVTP